MTTIFTELEISTIDGTRLYSEKSDLFPMQPYPLYGILEEDLWCNFVPFGYFPLILIQLLCNLLVFYFYNKQIYYLFWYGIHLSFDNLYYISIFTYTIVGTIRAIIYYHYDASYDCYHITNETKFSPQMDLGPNKLTKRYVSKVMNLKNKNSKKYYFDKIYNHKIQTAHQYYYSSIQCELYDCPEFFENIMNLHSYYNAYFCIGDRMDYKYFSISLFHYIVNRIDVNLDPWNDVSEAFIPDLGFYQSYLIILFRSIVNYKFLMIEDYKHDINFDGLPVEVNNLILQYAGMKPQGFMIDINDSIYEKKVNRRFPSRKIDYNYYKVNRIRGKKKIIIKDRNFYPQMGLYDYIIPKLDINVTTDTKAIVSDIKDMVDNVVSKGITHNINIPILDGLFDKLKYCWENESIRYTLLVVAYVCLKIYSIAKPLLSIICVDAIYLYLSSVADTVRRTYLFAISAAVNSLQLAQYLTSDDIQPQMDINCVEPILIPIYSWMYYSAFNKEYKGDYLSNFLKECQSVKKSKEGCADLIEFVINMFGKFTSLLQGRSFSDVFSNNLYPQLDKYAIQIDDYMKNFNKGIPFTKEEAMVILQIQADLDKLSRDIPNSTDFVNYKKKSVLLSNSLSQFIKEIKKAGLFDDGTRIIPLAILIIGPTGVGKSTNMPQLLFELAALTMDDELYSKYKLSKDDYQYTYNPENEYFDRYRKQYFCVVDEFGAKKDAPACPNEGYLFVMRAINCWAYPVHMADLADKGMMFDSKIIIAIGNLTHLMCKSLICPEAVSRRFDFSLMLVPKEEYCVPGFTSDPWTRRLDSEKLTGTITDTSHMEFLPYNIVDGYVSGAPCTWRNTIDAMSIKYHQKVKFSKLRIDGVPIMIEFCDKLRNRKIHPQMKNQLEEDISNTVHSITKKFNNSVLLDKQVITEKLTTLTNDLLEITESIKTFVLTNPVLVGLSTLTPILMVFWSFCKTAISPQSTFAKPKISIRAAARRNAKVVNSKNKAQMCLANVEFDNVSSCVLRSNHYRISALGSRGFMTFLKGRIAVMPHHYYDTWMEASEKGNNVVLEIEKAMCPGAPIQVNFTDIEFRELDDSTDIIFCYFPTMYMHRDVTKFLISLDDKLFKKKFHACLARFSDNNLKLHTTEAVPVGIHQYSHYTNNVTYEYRIGTLVGECGQLLFSTDSRTPTKLIGMHTAGDSKDTGLSIGFFKEDFDAVFQSFKDEGFEHTQVEPEEDFKVFTAQLRGIDPKFCVIKDMENKSLPTKSQIVKSALYNAWHISPYEPVRLYKNEDSDPWQNTRNNYNKPIKSCDSGLMKACANAIFTQLISNQRRDYTYPEILTKEQAIAGIPGRYKGIPRGTGFGYVEGIKLKGKGKTELFGSDGDYKFDSKKCREFLSHVDDCEEQLAKGVKVSFPFGDFLKDERRKVGKDPRLVSASGTDYTVLCRMYFGAFTMSLVDNRIHNGVCVGVNPFSEEWNTIAKHMKSVGDNCIFGDFTAYDASLFPEVMYLARDIIEKWYYWHMHEHPDYNKHKVIRTSLFESMVNSSHIAVVQDGTILYEFVGCVPSGHALTTFINSLCNIIIVLYCICKIYYGYNDLIKYPDPPPDFKFIFANYRFICFGDDNGISVSDLLLKVNQKTMTEAMSSIGMIYTSEDKSDNDYEHRSLDECSFLKCTFKYNRKLRRYVAAQALSSILDMPYWTKVNIKDEESVENTVDLLLAKLSLWGKSTYDEWCSKIVDSSVKLINYNPIRQDFDENVSYILTYEAEFY